MRAQNRLNTYKKEADERNARLSQCAPIDWRSTRQYSKARLIGYTGGHWGPTYSNDNKKMYLTDLEQIGEYLGDAHKLARRLDCTGYYSDNFQHGTIKFGVLKLRHARGIDYIPVTYSDEWDGVTAYIGDAYRVDKGQDQDVHDAAIRDMAYRADRCAELEADACRDDDAKQRAEEQISEHQDAIQQARAEARQLIAAIREQRQQAAINPTICDVLKASLRSLGLDVQRARDSIKSLQADYWSAVQ